MSSLMRLSGFQVVVSLLKVGICWNLHNLPPLLIRSLSVGRLRDQFPAAAVGARTDGCFKLLEGWYYNL